MRINAKNDYCISIELSDADLKELDITYDELDYSNIETRRVLWTVLGSASKSLGKRIDLSGKMLIEAQPLVDGGCLLGFTLLPESSKAVQTGRIIKRGRITVMFETNSADNLLDAFSVSGELVAGELYERNGKYRVIFDGATVLSETDVARLCEFGEVKNAPEALCAFTREHWLRVKSAVT